MSEPTTEPGFFRRTWNTGVEAFKRGWNGAEPAKPPVATVNLFSNGELLQEDLRARIRVPGQYIRESTIGNFKIDELSNGIIFPYTPQISLDYKADYKSMNATHSNYSQYFYSHSSVSAISIVAKFTVQNDRDAAVYISTKHLLSALTKMPYADDPSAGSPPPICRLDAYGPYMLKDIPVVISNFRIEFPGDVDYYSYKADLLYKNAYNNLQSEANARRPVGPQAEKILEQGQQPQRFGQNFVPTVSQFTINCLPVYSRREMLEFSLEKYLKDYVNNTKYL
jgi:hypothetical protein